MNCANHVDVPATAYCRTCGKPVCATCARDVRGVVYCEDCLASQVSGTMPPPPAPGVVLPGTPTGVGGNSPGLAALLGFIPGVGAMYNGEYAKGFIHVLIFATLIWATDNISPVFGLFIAAFCIYMPIEAYQTAKAKLMGVPPPDPFGLNNVLGHKAPVAAVVPPAASTSGATMDTGVQPGMAAAVPVQPAYAEDTSASSHIPVGAFILIGLGVLFLLNTFGWMHFDWVIARFWPIILILIGLRVLMKRQGY